MDYRFLARHLARLLLPGGCLPALLRLRLLVCLCLLLLEPVLLVGG
jgi:hypothetical protein